MNIIDSLKGNPERDRLFHHPIFQLEVGDFNREDAKYLLGQYWHPLHYFPNFLSQLIVDAPRTDFKCSIANILNEELGEGDISQAHEVIYLNTFESLDFDRNLLTKATPSTATRGLIECYRSGASNFLVGLGGLYATESTDLAIVSGIGKLLDYVAPCQNGNEWINIHLEQEPNHVKQTDFSVGRLSSDEERIVIKNAEEMWKSWSNFFDDVLLSTHVMKSRYVMVQSA